MIPALGLSTVPSPKKNESGLADAAALTDAEGVAIFAAASPGTITLAAGLGMIRE